MAELWLVCEGLTDIDVLRPVLTRVLATDIIVEPARGEASAASVAIHLRQQAGVAAYVRDRDYRTRSQADASYTDGKPGFYWRRHSIENYLIQPEVIIAAFDHLRNSMADLPNGAPDWVSTLPTESADVVSMLTECAALLAPREAARLALWRLREKLNDDPGPVQLREPPLPNPEHTSDVAESRLALVDEVARFKKSAEATFVLQSLTDTAISQRFESEYERITSEEYVGQSTFLEEFHGKDILKAFRMLLNASTGLSLGDKLLRAELTTALPDVYSVNRMIFGTDDFKDLANGVRSLAGLAPIS